SPYVRHQTLLSRGLRLRSLTLYEPGARAPPAAERAVPATPPARAPSRVRHRDVPVPPPEAGLGPGHVHARDARPAADHRPCGRDPVLYGMERRRSPRDLFAAPTH